MKNKRKRWKWLILASMCTVGLFFSCTDYIWQDIESSRQSSNTNTKLTVSVAKEWYENNYAPVVTVRSASQDSTLRPMKPDWKKAKESKWEKRDWTHRRWMEVKKLNEYIDKRGNLRPEVSIADFESRILNKVVPGLQLSGYPSDRYPFNYDRLGLDNFKNIRELTKNCNQ